MLPHGAWNEKPNATKSSCQTFLEFKQWCQWCGFFLSQDLTGNGQSRKAGSVSQYNFIDTRITGVCWSKKWSSVPSPCWHCPCWRPPATMHQVRWRHESQTIGCFSGKHDPLSNNGSRRLIVGIYDFPILRESQLVELLGCMISK